MELRDSLIGTETKVVERSASHLLHKGDIIYGQVWKLAAISILGSMAPISIPSSLEREVIALRKNLCRRMAKQNRDLVADDLLWYADTVRLTYLNIRAELLWAPWSEI